MYLFWYGIVRLVDVISKLQLQKASVSRHMASVLEPILEKGIVDHSIIHRALVEYLSIADQVVSDILLFLVPRMSNRLSIAGCSVIIF